MSLFKRHSQQVVLTVKHYLLMLDYYRSLI